MIGFNSIFELDQDQTFRMWIEHDAFLCKIIPSLAISADIWIICENEILTNDQSWRRGISQDFNEKGNNKNN